MPTARPPCICLHPGMALFSPELWPGQSLLSPLQCLCSRKSLRRECTFPHFSLRVCQENSSHSFKF